MLSGPDIASLQRGRTAKATSPLTETRPEHRTRGGNVGKPVRSAGLVCAVSLLILPCIAVGSVVHLNRGETAVGVSTGLYRANDFTGFDGSAAMTLFGVLDIGFAVERASIKTRRVDHFDRSVALVEADRAMSLGSFSSHSTGPTAYPMRPGGPNMTTFEPSAAVTVRLPNELMLTVGGSYEWSHVPNATERLGYAGPWWGVGPVVETNPDFSGPPMYEWRYSTRGFSAGMAASRRFHVTPGFALVPSVGMSYQRGKLTAEATEYLTNYDDGRIMPLDSAVDLWGPIMYVSPDYVDTRSQIAYNVSVEAVLRHGAHVFIVGPQVSLGKDGPGARLSVGYVIVAR